MGKIMPAYFGITANDNGYGSAMGFTNNDYDGGIIGLKRINGDIPGMKTTFEEAKELAEDALRRVGIVEGVSLVYTELGFKRCSR